MPLDATLLTPAIEVDGLTVRFRKRGVPEVCAVNGVSFSLARGQVLTILGESGSGKSVSLKAIMGLLPGFAEVEGQVRLAGRDILALPPRELAKLRGGEVSMIFQEPMAAMDPVYTIGDQIAETIVQHEGTSRATAMARAKGLLERVSIPSAARRLKNYPHEMSGGMRQRAMIALALACKPAILLADEPTTALDVTIQAQILDLLLELRAERGMAVMLITHNMGVVAETADRVLVMYSGQVVEQSSAAALFDRPAHPYTSGLLACVPSLEMDLHRLQAIPGALPDPARRPPGCRFAPRCPLHVAECDAAVPALLLVHDGHEAACIRTVA